MKVLKLVIIFPLIFFGHLAMNCFASEKELMPPERTVKLFDIITGLQETEGNAADDYIICINSLRNRSKEEEAITNFSKDEFNLIKMGNQKSFCTFCPQYFNFLEKYREKNNEIQGYFKDFADHEKFANRTKEYSKNIINNGERYSVFKETFETELVLGYRLQQDSSITYDINVLGIVLQLAASEILGNLYNANGELEKAELCNKYLKETKEIGDFIVDRRKRLTDEDYALKVLLKDPYKAWRVDAATRLGVRLS